MDDLLSKLTAYQSALCKDQASPASNSTLTATFHKYILQKKALRSAHAHLTQIKAHYLAVKQLKEQAQVTLSTKLDAQLNEEISTETDIYRKFALFQLMNQPSPDLKAELTAQLIASITPRIKWRLQKNSAELELISNDSLPFIHPELYLDSWVIQRLQEIVQSFGVDSIQVKEIDRHSIRIERTLHSDPRAIDLLQQFLQRHFKVPCLLQLDEEDSRVRKAQNVLFAESTSLATWKLHPDDLDPSTLANLTLLQCATAALAKAKRHTVRNSFYSFLEMCPDLSLESILALSNGYFCQAQCALQDLESASLLFNEGQALLELVIPRCSIEEGHLDLLVSLHLKSSASLRALLQALNPRSLGAIRELYCGKLSLWIKNEYCEAIVADLLVDYHNECVIGRGAEGWVGEFEAFLGQFPKIVPFLDVKKRALKGK